MYYRVSFLLTLSFGMLQASYKGKDKEEKNEKETVSLLFNAVENNDYSKLQRFLADKQHSSLNYEDAQGKTLLHRAAENNNMPIIQLLVDNGADLNKIDSQGNTPLHYLVNQGNQQGVAYCLLKEASTNIANFKGESPISYALAHEDEWLAQLLINYGASLDFFRLNIAGNDALEAFCEESW